MFFKTQPTVTSPSSPWENCGMMCTNVTFEARDLWVASCKSPSLFGSTVVSGYVSWACCPLSSMSQLRCCAGCGNSELWVALFVSRLWTVTERIQWNLVIAGRQEKTRPVVTVQVCTPNGSTMVPMLCDYWTPISVGEISECETVVCTHYSCDQCTDRIGTSECKV